MTQEVQAAFTQSWLWGKDRIEEMVGQAACELPFAERLVREYLTRHIRYELSARHLEGLALFRSLARSLEASATMV